MDPLTLFALAQGAVKAVKKGCELYKEISGAANDVKGVLQDLESQFTSRHKNKPPTVAEKNQYITEKNRILELSKRQPDDIYTEIGESLGNYFENMATCMAIFEEEEKHSKEVYTGETSLGKRALQRVLMQSRLTAMEAELRELMVYNCPPELGDLYTRVYAMMDRMKREQSVAWARKNQKEKKAAKAFQIKKERLKKKIWWWGTRVGITFIIVAYLALLSWSVVQIRIDNHPELGVCLIPKGNWLYKHYNNLIWIDCEQNLNKEK